jgi:hypothetical protein
LKNSFLSLICLFVVSLVSTAATEDGVSTLKRPSNGSERGESRGKGYHAGRATRGLMGRLPEQLLG